VAGQRLGQHFLKSERILALLAEAACPDHEPLVVEIGPGHGALTRHLLDRADRVIAVEIDAALALDLSNRMPAPPRFTVLLDDVLKTDLGQWGPAVVAGNLPYYITSPILERIAAMGARMRRAVLLVQREVAARITAAPGSRDYGFLSVRTQFYAEPALLFPVPPGAFLPPPEVDSAAVRLLPRPEGFWGVPAPDFLRFAGQCFRQKRKTLRNNLAGAYPRDAVEAQPEAGLRAEQLPLSGLVALFGALEATRGQAPL
jgi:16S rRNA (adenine1518-N6/adenine1519-N6)-dimethyltransferase